MQHKQKPVVKQRLKGNDIVVFLVLFCAQTVSIDHIFLLDHIVLVGLAQKFDGFEDELLLSKQKKKDENEKRLRDLQNQLDNLKTSLELESRNREVGVVSCCWR